MNRILYIFAIPLLISGPLIKSAPQPYTMSFQNGTLQVQTPRWRDDSTIQFITRHPYLSTAAVVLAGSAFVINKYANLWAMQKTKNDEAVVQCLNNLEAAEEEFNTLIGSGGISTGFFNSSANTNPKIVADTQKTGSQIETAAQRVGTAKEKLNAIRAQKFNQYRRQFYTDSFNALIDRALSFAKK